MQCTRCSKLSQKTYQKEKILPKLHANDLVSVRSFNCEGIETPWGWFPNDPPPKKSEQSLNLKKIKKVKVSPDATGIVIEHGHSGSDEHDEHYVILVEGKALSVPVRFLNKLD